jgi:hypothetical protein
MIALLFHNIRRTFSYSDHPWVDFVSADNFLTILNAAMTSLALIICVVPESLPMMPSLALVV